MFQERFNLNRAYLMSLSSANLLQNYYLEAGLQSFRQKPEDIHWGWEAPTCQLRGHFLGHWLSGARASVCRDRRCRGQGQGRLIS